MKRILPLLIPALFFQLTFGYAQIKRCATHDLFIQNGQDHPGYAEAVQKTFDQALEMATNRTEKTATVYRIPVVVHVVYETAIENLADSIILSQIESLNEDFRRMTADTAKTRDIFKPVAVDTEIEFYLADLDPAGNPTTGIDRVSTTVTSFGAFDPASMDKLKQTAEGGADAWDVDHYLNIWVGDISFFGFTAILGYAYPPVGAPNWPAGSSPTDPDMDGVVIHYEVFGRNNPLATGPLDPVGEGRTCTHEVGHYLGLRHIWGDGGGFSGIPGCTVDDGVTDTPNAEDASAQDCDTTKNSCTDSPIDLPDMIENYMDYSDERCMNMFTQGQVDIMRSMIEGPRSGLLTPSVSIDRPAIVSTMNVWPNPTTGIVNLGFDTADHSNAHLTVSNLLGEVVLDLNGSQISSSLDLSDIRAGLYIIRIETNSKSFTARIVHSGK